MCHEPSSMNSARPRSSRGWIVTRRITEAKGWLETCHYYILNIHYPFGSREMIRKKSAWNRYLSMLNFKIWPTLPNEKSDKVKSKIAFVFSSILTSYITTVWCQPESQKKWRWNWFCLRKGISWGKETVKQVYLNDQRLISTWSSKVLL